MEILNFSSSSNNNSYSYDNNNLFFKLSIAESQLKEYFKEDSLIKAVNIIKEILSSKEIEKNLKNILNILLSKIMECYTRCDNKTRFIINHIIFLNKKKFSNIFLNKDVINYLIAVVTCSDTIARGYSLQLISYLPALIEKRLDLLHTTFDLFVNEKVPHEEKLIICEVYRQLLQRSSPTKINLANLLISNLESILSFKHCRNIECEVKYCEVCFSFKYKAILLYRMISNIRTDTIRDNLSDSLKAYLLKHQLNYFKISCYIMLLIKSLVGSVEFLSFINSLKIKFGHEELDDNLTSSNIRLAIAYLFNFLDFEDEKSLCLFKSNFDVFKMLFANNEEAMSHTRFHLRSVIDKNFFLANYLFYLMYNEDRLEIEQCQGIERCFRIKKINFQQFIKILTTIVKLQSCQTDIRLGKLKINSIYLRVLVDYFKSMQVNFGFIRSGRKYFENHKSVEHIFNILKKFRNNSEIREDLNMILTNNLFYIVKDFRTKKEYQNYFYLLCLCIKYEIDTKKFEEILLTHYPNLNNSDISNFVLKGIIKFYLRYNSSNQHDQIEKFSQERNFLTSFYIFKEYYLTNKIEEGNLILKQNSSENNPSFLNFYLSFLNKVLSIKFNILKHLDLIETRNKLENEVDVLLLFTELSSFSKERNSILEKNKKIMSPFASEFSSNPIDIIKNLLNLYENISRNNPDKIKKLINNLLNTPLVIWLAKDNKLCDIIDVKLNYRRNDLFLQNECIKSLILHYSKYLLVISPPLDILIKYEVVRDKHDKYYKIGLKIKLKNLGEYIKCKDSSGISIDSDSSANIFCDIYADGKLLKKESFDVNNCYKDMDYIFENESGHHHEDIFKGGTSMTKGVVIKLQFYLIYDEVYLFHFYESTYCYTYDK